MVRCAYKEGRMRPAWKTLKQFYWHATRPVSWRAGRRRRPANHTRGTLGSLWKDEAHQAWGPKMAKVEPAKETLWCEGSWRGRH